MSGVWIVQRLVRVYRTLGGFEVPKFRQYLFSNEIEEKWEGEENPKGRKEGRNPTKWDNKKRGGFKILDIGHRRIQLFGVWLLLENGSSALGGFFLV